MQSGGEAATIAAKVVKTTITVKRKKAKTTTRLSQLFNALSDDMSIQLFRLIASDPMLSRTDDGEGKRERLIDRAKLTRKQFYSRIERLVKTGLIKRRNDKYQLTSLGKVAYDILDKAENAVNIEWRLKAVDSFTMTNPQDIPKEELAKLIDKLVDNKVIKDILMPQKDA